MLVWPIELFPAPLTRWRLSNVSASGGVSVGGQTRYSVTDGGGQWVCDMQAPLWTRQQLKAARALEGLLDGGAASFVIPACECVFAPWPTGSAPDDEPHSDDAPFSDFSEYVTGAIDITLSSTAALRATTLALTLTSAAALEGGERFSIDHTTKGRRLYTIVQIDGTSATIRPPLREETPSGTALNFDDPGCVMRIVNPEAFFEAINLNRLSNLTPSFQEAF